MKDDEPHVGELGNLLFVVSAAGSFAVLASLAFKASDIVSGGVFAATIAINVVVLFAKGFKNDRAYEQRRQAIAELAWDAHINDHTED